jgi:hypothetical protein
MLTYSTDLPYILRERMMRIKDTTFDKRSVGLKKVKSFARLASKPFAITEESHRIDPITESLLQL